MIALKTDAAITTTLNSSTQQREPTKQEKGYPWVVKTPLEERIDKPRLVNPRARIRKCTSARKTSAKLMGFLP